MAVSKRNFLRNIGVLSTTLIAGCNDDAANQRTTTDSQTHKTTSETKKTVSTADNNPEYPGKPELKILNRTSNEHTVKVVLAKIESVPDGPGTPVESGEFALNKQFELAGSKALRLSEHREVGEDYNLFLSVDGNVVVDELLTAYSGLTVKIFGSEDIETQWTAV